MSDKKDMEDCPSEEASSQAESFDANKSGTSETYDMKDFCPGIRIEAKDFDGKWYPAKVSDVDWTENEILVHFENWNTKFDEWIPMDSSRLRPLQKPVLQQKDLIKFSKGEEVMAMWSPYQKYPATIQAVLANDRYDVLFYDGFLKRLKSHKISKLEGETVKSEVRNFTDIGTKEERRERKRKINVAELFHINKRSRKKGLMHSKSQELKTYPVAKSKNKNSVLKKLITPEENKDKITNVESIEVKPKDEKLQTSLPTKSLVDTIPAAFEVKYLNGQTEMWSKQLYQRSEGRTAGKLDIVILNPQGRKFRSRNEIMKFCEENGIIYSHEAFDFSAKGRPKSKPAMQTPPLKLDTKIEEKDKLTFRKSHRKGPKDVPAPAPQNFQEANSPDILPLDSNYENKVFIGDFEVVIENGKFICPVKSCAKHFRRENLLHMHMKHYHPEFSKYLDYTPSVTDLAYARTVGGLDGAEVSSPAPRKITEKSEKLSTKVENVRKASETSFDYSKETKKLKISDSKIENKSTLGKALTDSSVSAINENSTEDTQKNKLNLNNLLVKNNYSTNEFSFRNESSAFERNDSALENKSPESVPPESASTVSSHSMIKSIRHHRLHSRKKTNRFQGSFVEHMKKKKLISKDHSRSQNKLGRQQQSQHIRQQLQEVLPPQTTIPSQSSLEETLSNCSSQAHTFSRYPKTHLNIQNEISGKNNLLTSSNNLSPVSMKVNSKKNSFKNDDNAKGESEKTMSVLDNNDELSNSDSQAYKKIKAMKQCNRRSFLTGLINARKRRAKASFCWRKKKKKKIRKVQSTESCWETKLCNSGLNQIVEKPDAIIAKNQLSDYPVNRSTNVSNNDASHNCNSEYDIVNAKKLENDELKTIDTPVIKKSIRIKIKRTNGENLKLVESDSEIKKSGKKKESSKEFICINNESFANDHLNVLKNQSKFDEELIKTDNFQSIKISSADKELLINKNNPEVKIERKAITKSTENEGLIEVKPERDNQCELNVKDLPKSCVLLENVCRKEIYNKYVNISRKGNDENVGDNQANNSRDNNKTNVSPNTRSKSTKKKKRGGKLRRRKDVKRQTTTKKVRFESTVMEKWISTDDGDDYNHAMSAYSKNKEGRREERKKKVTKCQLIHYLNETEVNHVKRSDDSLRDEISLPHNNSSLDSKEVTEESKSTLVLENDKVEKLRRNEIINCVCGITEEDGLMIQCDLCLCWQHGHCAGIFRESDVPDKYTCAICKNPYRGRSSMKYLHDQEWLKEGTLPSLSFRSKRDEIINQRKTILKRSYDLSGSIALLARVIHSLRLKVNIAEKKDHPKLWIWAKKWTEKKPSRLKEESEKKEEKSEEQSLDISVSNRIKEEILTEDEKQLPKAPEPEAPIDSAECKLNLLDHLIHYQTLVDARLSCIESLVAELESMQDDAVNDETPDRYPRTKATVQMLLRDLNTMKKIAII